MELSWHPSAVELVDECVVVETGSYRYEPGKHDSRCVEVPTLLRHRTKGDYKAVACAHSGSHINDLVVNMNLYSVGRPEEFYERTWP